MKLFTGASLLALAVACAPPEGPPPPPAGPGFQQPPESFDDGIDDEDLGGEGEGEGTIDDDDVIEEPEEPTLDPAPGIETLGEHSDGTDCPTATPAESFIDAGAVTSHTFAGTVSASEGNGVFYVRGRNQEEIAGEIPMSGDGYSVTLPIFCGENIVKRVWSNSTCTAVVVTSVTTSDCVDAALRVTTVWDGDGRDWELHLVKPGGSLNDNASDCTWTSCVNASPDWGAAGEASDNPRKDVDHLQAYGPENIFLDGLEPGIYTVLVEHWSSSGASTSDGRVIINMEDKLVVIDIEDLAPFEVWTAARISWPDATVLPSQDVHDCSANWSSGCRDALPVAP